MYQEEKFTDEENARFAKKMIEDFGIDGALARTTNYAVGRRAVDIEIARLNDEAKEHKYEISMLHG